MSAGIDSVVALDTSGHGWGWGDDSCGALGDGRKAVTGPGTVARAPVPMKMPAGVRFTAVSEGADGNGVALDARGRLWQWGGRALYSCGRLGRAPTLVDLPGTRFVAVSASSGFVALDDRGDAWQWGAPESTLEPRRVPIPPDVQFTAISAGPTVSSAIDTDGRVWSWGDNLYGQFGDGTIGGTSAVPRPAMTPAGVHFVSVSAGEFATAALSSAGQVWDWGSNSAGELGDGTLSPSTLPVRAQLPSRLAFRAVSAGGPVPSDSVLALDAGGRVWGWGDDSFGETGQLPVRFAQPQARPRRVSTPVGITFSTLAAGGTVGVAIRGAPPALPTHVPGAPSALTVTAGNGELSASWLPGYDGASPLTGYRLSVEPFGDDDLLAPRLQAVVRDLPARQRSTTVTGLLADCHATYLVSVTARNVNGTGPPARGPSGAVVVRPSGHVLGPPPVTAILLDGEGSSLGASGSFDPLAQHSYCSLSSTASEVLTELEADWDTDYPPLDVAFDSSGRPRGLATHHYLTDQIAAWGGVVLPYSYAGGGATLHPDGTFSYPGYGSQLSSTQDLASDVAALAREVASIHRAWPRTKIVLIGHSWGGVIAEQYWKSEDYRADGVAKVFSLDSPINGTATAAHCAPVAGACQFFSNIGASLITEMADRWQHLQALDAEIIARDRDASYLDVGTEGDPAYGATTNGTVFGNGPATLISQLVFSSCDNTTLAGACTPADPPSVASPCSDAGDSPWASQGHFSVRECAATADLIDRNVDSLLGVRVLRYPAARCEALAGKQCS